MNIKVKTINSMRAIALDAINQAGQGHIGMAIGAAPITYSIIGELLNITKDNPKWINRDRFVLSAGHGSMAQYSIAHFLGLLSKEDMKAHKVLHSKTPSHPEIDQFDYVDASTGPLGQGVAMAVGMAISQRYLKKQFNKPEFKIIDHHIYALHGDGCLQEGVGLEAIQLAGTLQLSEIILVHDFNNVQIDSSSSEVNNTNLIKFFQSQGYATFEVEDPTHENILAALKQAQKSNQPSYVQVKTKIAFATPLEGVPAGHNGVLNKEETLTFKKKLELEDTKPFEYSDDVYKHAQELWLKKEQNYKNWQHLANQYKTKYPQEYATLMNIYHNKIKNSVEEVVFAEKNVATRNYIIPLLKHLEKDVNIIGGSADLAGATKVKFNESFWNGGKNIRYGVREFSMVAINNGVYLHSGLRTINSTFLAFADYAKAAIRLGAIQKVPGIHIFTHDSYQVGGDGPTHQPVEQITMLRAIHGLKVIRPADASEMKAAFQYALDSSKTSTAIIACRQPVPSYNLLTGPLVPAYIVKDYQKFDLSILATGSEVGLAMEVVDKLAKKNIFARVISVPLLQDLITDVVLIKKLKLNLKPMFVIEASNDSMWYRLAAFNKVSGHFATDYGYSAPGDVVYHEKGFNVDNIIAKVHNFLDY